MKHLLIIGLAVLAGCTGKKEPLTAESIINKSIVTHGLNNLDGTKIEFNFRDRHYSVLRNEGIFTYTRSFVDSLGYVEDILVNSSEFTRLVDGTKLEMDKEWSDKYSNSVNSVLYFVQLPYTLNDPAALKAYQGIQEIKGKRYHQVEIRFEEAGGGKDFEDVFLYWFSEENFSMDYFAYSYITDGGGVRFRESINKRTVEEIVFQDYINYKPENEKTTPLVDLLDLFNKGELLELSRIVNENVVVN